MDIRTIFSNKSGKVVIAQFPNVPLWSAIGFYALKFSAIEHATTISFWGLVISLSYWSYLEITSGVNAMRKGFGVTVAIIILIMLFQRI